MNNIPWWGYVILAGLAWGTYVPIIFYGGTELTTRPGTIGGRLASILCVGVAYFVLGVVVPLILMSLRDDAKPDWKTNGLVFSALAGVAGAVGAICVIFASKAAVDTAKGEFETREAALVAQMDSEADPAKKAATEAELKEFRGERAKFYASYRILIAPLIFSLAPLINTLLSLIWHPKPGDPFHFGFDLPSWHLPVGIVLVAVGTFLVLYSKEAAEANKAAPKPSAAAPTPAAPKA
ncbi:Hypothetical conserved protein OS=uncultured planctomycete GN=HGMM_F09D09C13 PE=4 SV=1 [Gemmataceae bacterium]|nr:Hypothetical conserved protein OS=uncultured planctomycete GN=HGMM_F09D09C13 PE=4 SV=1 [Gemmataceae bacterium]VTU00823.1 Hypothetical conserved protein OS=uncultured planctomycete GN=HGMM_F09D09C13 PE=4 SV=1 [Gemmataceae bacterium]